jgi:hypothetical protein
VTLIVEDGTGLSNAEAYASAAEFTAYVADMGYELTPAVPPLASLEAALRRATNFIDSTYAERWPGYPRNGRAQMLDWPRLYVVDSNGYPVPSDVVPAEVVTATMEAALREHTTPNSLLPDVTAGQRVISETVGPISVRYSDKGDADTAATPNVPIIDKILYPLLLPGGGSVKYLRRA